MNDLIGIWTFIVSVIGVVTLIANGIYFFVIGDFLKVIRNNEKILNNYFFYKNSNLLTLYPQIKNEIELALFDIDCMEGHFSIKEELLKKIEKYLDVDSQYYLKGKYLDNILNKGEVVLSDKESLESFLTKSLSIIDELIYELDKNKVNSEYKLCEMETVLKKKELESYEQKYK